MNKNKLIILIILLVAIGIFAFLVYAVVTVDVLEAHGETLSDSLTENTCWGWRIHANNTVNVTSAFRQNGGTSPDFYITGWNNITETHVSWDGDNANITNGFVMYEGNDYLICGVNFDSWVSTYTLKLKASPVSLPDYGTHITWLGGGRLVTGPEGSFSNRTEASTILHLVIKFAEIDVPIISEINFTGVIPHKTCPSFINNCINTSDSTPSFKITIDEDASCRLASSDVDYSEMNITMIGSNVSDTHTGAFDFNLPEGVHIVYFGCNDENGNSHTSPLPTANKANFTVDTVSPLIDFVDTTTPNGTFIASKNWIDANVAATDISLKNITIFLYNSDGTLHDSRSQVGNELTNPFSANFTGLPQGLWHLNATAFDYAGNINATGTNNITLIYNYTIFFNELASERKYEYGSNVSINVTSLPSNISLCLFVNDINVTCGLTPFLEGYIAHPIHKRTFNNSLTNYTLQSLPGNFTFNFSTEVDFNNATFTINVTQQIGLRNLYVKVDNKMQDMLIGLINGTNITIDRFHENLQNTTLTFTQADLKVFQFNMSIRVITGGSFFVAGLITSDNELFFRENFTNISRINLSISNGSIGNMTYDDFDTDVSGRWNKVENNDFNATIDTQFNRMKLSGSCSGSDCGKGGHINGILNNISRFSRISFEVNGTASASCFGSGTTGIARARLYLNSDKAGEVRELVKVFLDRTCTFFTVGEETRRENVTLVNLGDGNWNFTEESILIHIDGDNINLEIQADVSTSSGSGNSVSTSINAFMQRINVSGVGNNISSPGNLNPTFNFTSIRIHSDTNNIVSAKLTAGEFNDESGGSFQYYMSTDSQVWENVQKNQFHTFTNAGTELFYRVEGINTTRAVPYGVFSIDIDVINRFPENITFDFGQNGVAELSINDEVNTTTGPFQMNINNASTAINNYLFSNNCIGFSCLVPVSVTSQTPGFLLLSNSTITQTIGNISLNVSDLETLCTNILCDIDVELSSDTSAITNIKDLDVEFRGDANVSVQLFSGSINVFNRSFLVRYSKFNISSPSAFFDFYPQTINSTWVEPFGQDASRSVSIFNISSLASTDKATIWLALNESINSCLKLLTSNESDRTNNVSVNITYQIVGRNVTTTGQEEFYFWLNLTDCDPGSVTLEDPFSRYENSCDTCVNVWS